MDTVACIEPIPAAWLNSTPETSKQDLDGVGPMGSAKPGGLAHVKDKESGQLRLGCLWRPSKAGRKILHRHPHLPAVLLIAMLLSPAFHGRAEDQSGPHRIAD